MQCTRGKFALYLLILKLQFRFYFLQDPSPLRHDDKTEVTEPETYSDSSSEVKVLGLIGQLDDTLVDVIA